MKCFHYWFLTNLSHHLICSLSLLDRGSTSGSLGSTMWAMPLSIKNLKSKVGIVKRNILWKLSWKRFLILSKKSLSSIVCSSQKSSTICLTHYDKLVLPSFRSMCINCRCCDWLMNNFAITFEMLVEFSQGNFHDFLWKKILSLMQDSVCSNEHNF